MSSSRDRSPQGSSDSDPGPEADDLHEAAPSIELGDSAVQLAAHGAVRDAVGRTLTKVLARPLQPGLHIVATPIGQLADITLRAVAVLACADRVYCEDTRVSRTLLSHFGITRSLGAYHDHNAERERPLILKALADGKSVALISDAGTPLVSDPGYKLAADAAAAGVPVWAVPGASAVLAGLVAAGLPTDSFLFAGFLPAKSGARRTRIAELAAVPATLVFYESAGRLADTLADLSTGLGSRQAVVARELTKLHEEIRRGPLDELAEWAGSRTLKGEIAVVVGPPQAGVHSEVTDDLIRSQLVPVLDHLRISEAARTVAETLGVARARVYHIALDMKRQSGG